MNKANFFCDKCGLCCENLHRNEVFSEMHNGDGVCFNFNVEERVCESYKTRPLLCRVDEAYQSSFKNIYSKEEYYDLVNSACQGLKNNSKG